MHITIERLIIICISFDKEHSSEGVIAEKPSALSALFKKRKAEKRIEPAQIH